MIALGKEENGLEKQRLLCQSYFKRDFESFLYLLGYRDLGEFHKQEIAELQKYRYLGDYTVHNLWLWCRGFFKTSIITKAHSIWLIVNNPNIRILLVSYTMDVASMILVGIKSTFMFNEDFRYFFREYCPSANKEGKIEFGTTTQFTIPMRTKIYDEPTMMCAGVGTNITGLHFDWLKIDDLVNKESVNNNDQINASKEYFGYLRNFYDNKLYPKEDVVGTIYHFNDLHSVLNDDTNNNFHKSIRPAEHDGVYTFPQRMNRYQFEEDMNNPAIGPAIVYPQYQMQPFNPKDAKFNPEWWQEYDNLPDGLAEYVCVDPASTQKKKSDYTVIERWGIDYEGKHYLIEGIRDKMTVFERIDAVTDICKRAKRLVSVKYEVLGGRHGDLEQLKARFILERMYIEPTETRSTTSGKPDRIEQRLIGPWHAGIIFMPRTLLYKSKNDGKTYDFVQEYKLEYLQFPFSAHDDCLDSHSQMFEDLQSLQKGRKPVAAQPRHAMTADEEMERYEQIKKFASMGVGTQEAVSRLGIKQMIRKARVSNG